MSSVTLLSEFNRSDLRRRVSSRSRAEAAIARIPSPSRLWHLLMSSDTRLGQYVERIVHVLLITALRPLTLRLCSMGERTRR